MASLPSTDALRYRQYLSHATVQYLSGTILKLTSLQLANGLKPSNKWPVRVLHSLLVSGIDYSQNSIVMLGRPNVPQCDKRVGVMTSRVGVLTPTWRASPGELQHQLLELTRRVVREEKPIELFHW